MMLDPEKLLDLIQLTVPNVVKAVEYDRNVLQTGSGMLVSAITAIENANQGLPDYWVDVQIFGMTFAGFDSDGSVLRQIHADALGAVQRWTPAVVTAAFGLDEPAAVVGIINIASTFSNGAGYHEFSVTCRLATTELYLEYYEHPLPVFEIVNDGNGVQYLRFVNTSPCAVQRVTKQETTAPDGGKRSLFVYEVAYGDWDDCANLDYYPINTPVPVQNSN